MNAVIKGNPPFTPTARYFLHPEADGEAVADTPEPVAKPIKNST
jgi:hypothetical protein